MGINTHILTPFIEQVLTQGGQSNFLIVQLTKEYYIQIVAREGDTLIWVEAVSNNYLAANKALDDAQIQKLKSLDWKEQEDSNFFQDFDIYSDAKFAQLLYVIDETASEVYGVSKITESMVEINLE